MKASEPEGRPRSGGGPFEPAPPDITHLSRIPLRALSRDLKFWDKLFSSVTLPFDMQLQTQSNWCWAATAASVSLYYWPWSGWTQCKVLGFA
ncbi:MAG: hypothetical protein WD627_05655 [Actinomycetota bacterium]